MSIAFVSILSHAIIELILIVRVLTRPHRDPASRIAWIAFISTVPLFGVLGYLLFGETNIGRNRVARKKEVYNRLPDVADTAKNNAARGRDQLPERYLHLFQSGRSVNGFDVVGGNSGRLMSDSNASIDSMVADIDAATKHVHLLFYIWLPDNNGRKIVEALIRAALRGVKCRAMADDLGSRTMIHSPFWMEMEQAGVHLAKALPINNPFLRMLNGRVDLRNHRKILIIDGRITYCGSQNCADPEFLVKAKYAPWVDAVVRFEGPVVQQNQYLFASDWMSFATEDIGEVLQLPIEWSEQGFPAQVIGTGPTIRYSAMPEVFESLFHAARSELVISTPYYVPDDALQTALCAAAWRGVKTRLILPARNDSWIVGGASRSYYKDLLESGVEIFEYVGGLLHTKSLTLDGEITLIGSANMDRRSFELNYENNILLYDPNLTMKIRERQQEYLSQANPITIEMVDSWPLTTQLWNNALAMLGPVL